MARGTVARGHTIDIPTGERRMIGYDRVTGAPVFTSVIRKAGPGEEVTLVRSEIDRLRRAGFLVDPNKIVTFSSAELKRLDKTNGAPPPAA